MAVYVASNNILVFFLSFYIFNFFFIFNFLKVKLRENQRVPHFLNITPKYVNDLDTLQTSNMTSNFDFHLSFTISHIFLSLNIHLLIHL